MCINDHTDAEYLRLEHEHEMGSDALDREWKRWSSRVETIMSAYGWDHHYTGGKRAGQSMGLDGDQSTDGYSIDFAYDAFERGVEVGEYIDNVTAERRKLGLLA